MLELPALPLPLRLLHTIRSTSLVDGKTRAWLPGTMSLGQGLQLRRGMERARLTGEAGAEGADPSAEELPASEGEGALKAALALGGGGVGGRELPSLLTEGGGWGLVKRMLLSSLWLWYSTFESPRSRPPELVGEWGGVFNNTHIIFMLIIQTGALGRMDVHGKSNGASAATTGPI